MDTWQGLGGCSVYLSLALGRLGGAVIFATLVGEDVDLSWFEPLRQAGVDLRAQRLSGPTARLDLAYDQNGDIARLRFDAGIEGELDASQLPAEFWGADWILVGTGPRTYQASVATRAHGLGRAVSLSTQREFQGDWSSLATLLPHLDVLFINSGEVVDLRGDSLALSLDSMRAINPEVTCVVTCGWRGAFLLHDRWLYRVAACRGTIVNTTGAGDAFGATWLFTITRGGDPVQALRAASAAASLALGGAAHTTLPDWHQIQDKLKAYAAPLPVERWPIISREARAALAAEDARCHRRLDRQVRRS